MKSKFKFLLIGLAISLIVSLLFNVVQLINNKKLSVFKNEYTKGTSDLKSQVKKLEDEKELLIKENSDLKNKFKLPEEQKNSNNNTNTSTQTQDNNIFAKLGEEIKFPNTTIKVNSVKYGNTFNFIDANNGMSNSPKSGKGETFAILDVEISTSLDSAKVSSKQKWSPYDFIEMSVDKGYSPNSYWNNPHPTTIYKDKLNKFQIAATINKGDKISKITVFEPNLSKKVTINLN